MQVDWLDYSTHACVHSQVLLFFGTPWAAAHQAPLSMGFFRQEYWSGLPFPSPGDFPDPGLEPVFLYLPHFRQNLYRWASGEAILEHFLLFV